MVGEEPLSLVGHKPQTGGQGFPDAEAQQSSGQERSLNGGRFSDLELGDEDRSPVVT